jgi:hypothetical protein
MVHGALTLPISSPSYYISLVLRVFAGPAPIVFVVLVVGAVGCMLIVVVIEVVVHTALVVLHSNFKSVSYLYTTCNHMWAALPGGRQR